MDHVQKVVGGQGSDGGDGQDSERGRWTMFRWTGLDGSKVDKVKKGVQAAQIQRVGEQGSEEGRYTRKVGKFHRRIGGYVQKRTGGQSLE